MQIQQTDHTLTIRGLRELNAANARAVRDALCAAVVPGLHAIEVDLSELHFVDGCGLGALAALYRSATEIDTETAPAVRLINPQPSVQQIIELTRMHHLFEIVRCDDVPDPTQYSPATVPCAPLTVALNAETALRSP